MTENKSWLFITFLSMKIKAHPVEGIALMSPTSLAHWKTLSTWFHMIMKAKNIHCVIVYQNEKFLHVTHCPNHSGDLEQIGPNRQICKRKIFHHLKIENKCTRLHWDLIKAAWCCLFCCCCSYALDMAGRLEWRCYWLIRGFMTLALGQLLIYRGVYTTVKKLCWRLGN